MGDIRYGGWIVPVGVLLRLLAVITAQPGFLSIICGGKTNYTENNRTWVTDADYINVGETSDIGNASQGPYGSYLHHLRLFPKPLNKSCYQLPVAPDVPHLLRLWFAVGNYSGFKQLPSFQLSIETLSMLARINKTTQDADAHYTERIFVSSGTVLYICLIRTSETHDPFISAIELRTLQNGMYGEAKPGTLLWPGTYNVGGNSAVAFRYPQDKFDRIWKSADLYLYSQNKDAVWPVSSQEHISTKNTEGLPPTAVMQTAWVGNGSDIIGLLINTSQGIKSLLRLYFAEIQTLNMSESRSFFVKINDARPSETITLLRNYSAVELTFLTYQLDYFEVFRAPNSTRPPILNAFEYHWLYDTDHATYAQDIDALHAMKMSFDIKDWISDPCYSIPWRGIGCDSSSSAIRISKIDLSRRNLTGSVPNSIGQLTSVVDVSLDNNDLMGSLPDFSNLTMLERLYLQNNNLSGPVPEWLSELKNLQELNIDNNNFSGVIPAQLFLNCSLKFKLSYSGNRYLRMDEKECTLKSSNNNKLKVVLGTTFSGIVMVALALIAGIAVYLKKFRRKEDGVATKSSSKGAKSSLYSDYSKITVPNTTKSRVFTLDEMIASTQNFSREIGRGGFGSVFFGKLPEGKEIAVKVLSLFSRQGVHEFLNEVDLLSRINHRNLVSLLGYCNETKVMLIYEYMSGGSLRDHLYGPGAENSEVNWKTRLKIVLDAARGLEYLHVGSTQKIIHRDVKTANILLDSNLNGKLADFGISRIAIDEEATHVTTAVKGTLGYLDPDGGLRMNETMRVIMTAVCGIVIGFFVGASFPRDSLPKFTFPSALMANSINLQFPEDNNASLAEQIYVPTNPRGAETLAPGIVVAETDLYLRRLWGKPSEDLPFKQKYLVVFTVGFAQKDIVNTAISKFSGNFTILLFHYDGRTSEWDEFEWSKKAVHISAMRQTKWWYAKRFLHPDVIAPFEYIFIWDEDLGVEHFNAEEYIKLVRKHGLEISQPALEPRSGLTWQMTRKRDNVEVHKETTEQPGWCRDPHLPPCAGFVEIMAPVFSRKAWRCVWYMIQNDLVHGWGLDLAIGRCAQPANENVGVVDAQWIVHNGVPSLGNQGESQQGKPGWEGVRTRCRDEWAEFQNRMEKAEKDYLQENSHS